MTIRVICMGSGQMGMAALQEVIQRPELELVGLHAYSEWKTGMDAADIVNGAKELIGSIDAAKNLGFDSGTPLEKTGIPATCSFEEIVAMDADLVIYTTLGAGEDLPENDEQVKVLLRSGKSVITPTGYTFPWVHGDDFAKGFEDACKEGNSTLFCAGIDPGFLVERMLVTLASNCLEIDSISFTEMHNVSTVPSPQFLFKLMGIGKPLEYFDDKYSGSELAFTRYFKEITAYLANALGVELDSIEMAHEYGVTDKPIETMVGTVAADTVVNFRRQYYGMKDGKRWSTVEITWILDDQMEGFRDLPDGWNFGISGRPGFEMRIDPKNPDWSIYPGAFFGAQLNVIGPIIRAIPEVINAEPGILVPPPVFGAYKHGRL